jgi:DNA polymerase I-like protein with 3'-5' exonuclease and polymerase domains
MQTRCPLCYSWTFLPAHYPAGQPIHPRCDGCGDELPGSAYAHRYDLCRVCLHCYLTDYGACPLCPPATDLATALAWQHLWLDHGTMPTVAPLSDRYCIALWQGYQQDQSGTAGRAPSGGGGRSGNGYTRNGNGAGKGHGNGARPATRPVALAAAPAEAPPAEMPANMAALLTTGPVALFEMDAPAPVVVNGNGHDADTPAVTVRSDEGLSGVDYELIQDSARLVEVADLLNAEPLLGVDTETDGLDPYTSRLLLLQVATPQKAYIVDCQRVDPLPLKPILESTRSLKILQNAKFDYKILKHIAGIELCNIFDTMLAERLLTAGRAREVSLRQLALKYAGVTMDKTIRKSFVGVKGDGYLSEEQLVYAARDALVMFEIQRTQQAELKKLRMTKVAELEFQCVAAVGDMELAGVKIDTDRWRAILTRVAVERDRAAEELNEMLAAVAKQATMFGVPTINLNSGPQLIEVFARLGVELADTSEATLIKAGDHPAIKKLLEYRSHEKTLSAFGEHLLALINPQTGRLHPDFNQYGADTGRFSCTNPNVQQIPATSDFRSCFVAAEGYKLCTCDYSQAELRILAELSGDPAFVEAFRGGGDLHAITASQMFQVPLDQVQKQQRSAAKSINFGLAYGRGPGSLALQLGVSSDEAKALIEKYFQAYTGIQQWLDKAAREAVRKGYSETTLGRRRFYDVPDRNDPDYRQKIGSIERQGKNTPIQGGNADMTKIALVYLRSALRGYNARVVNTVHDEIVVEVIAEQAEEVKKIVEHEMIRAGEQILQTVPVVADAAIGDYWKK